MKRIGVVLGVAALLAAMLAAPVAAEPMRIAAEPMRTEINQPFGPFYVVNPCNDETIQLNGTTEGFALTVPTGRDPANTGATSVEFIKIHTVSSGTGVGETTGDQYYFSTTLNQESYFPRSFLPRTFTRQITLVNQDTGENFILNMVFHFSPDSNGNVNVTVDTAGTHCPS
jgi:hypothetical protein